jgi:hypothetical protein
LEFLSPQLHNGLYGHKCAMSPLPVTTIQRFFFHAHLDGVTGDESMQKDCIFSHMQTATMHSAHGADWVSLRS